MPFLYFSVHDFVPFVCATLVNICFNCNADQIVTQEEITGNNVYVLPPQPCKPFRNVLINGMGHLPETSRWVKQNVSLGGRQLRHRSPHS